MNWIIDTKQIVTIYSQSVFVLTVSIYSTEAAYDSLLRRLMEWMQRCVHFTQPCRSII